MPSSETCRPSVRRSAPAARRSLPTASWPTSPNRRARSGSTSHRSRCASTPTCSARPLREPGPGGRRDVPRDRRDPGRARGGGLPPARRSASRAAPRTSPPRTRSPAVPTPTLPRRLDVVCLFESGAELARATDILDEVVRIPAVRARLRRNGGRLEVMLGYSDSSKEAGVLAASLALVRRAARDRGVGTGPRHRAHGLPRTRRRARAGRRTDRARDPCTAAGHRRRPVQGHRTRRGRVRPVRRRRHRLAPSGAARTRGGERRRGPTTPDPADAFADEIATMRTASEAAWRALVDAPGFARCVTRATPIKQIASMPIASRPVSRTSSVEDLDALRAIPWVFSWAQARVNLPGWFGLGTGLEAVADDPRRARPPAPDAPDLAVLRGLAGERLGLAREGRPDARRALPRPRRPTRTRSRDLRRVGPHRTDAAGVTGEDAPARRRGAGCAAPSTCARPTSTRCRTCSCGSSTIRRPRGSSRRRSPGSPPGSRTPADLQVP